MIIGFLVLVLLVGDGLIYLLYGKGPALAGLGCILAGLIPVGAVVFFLWLTEKLVKNRDV